MSKSGSKVTFRGALAGRWRRLSAIGVGSFGLSELLTKRLAPALACLVAALILTRVGPRD